jgi:hypothetical protein
VLNISRMVFDSKYPMNDYILSCITKFWLSPPQAWTLYTPSLPLKSGLACLISLLRRSERCSVTSATLCLHQDRTTTEPRMHCLVGHHPSQGTRCFQFDVYNKCLGVRAYVDKYASINITSVWVRRAVWVYPRSQASGPSKD